MSPFIIVGMPRTGSTLLMTGISQHPQAQVYGELFHMARSERAGAHAIHRNGETIFFDEHVDDAIDFLDKNVFKPNEHAVAVGFKVFAEMVSCRGTEHFFSRMKEHYKHLRVIHIVRDNYLDVLVSREVALKTNEWIRYANAKTKPVELPKIIIEPAKAERFFKAIKNTDKFFGTFFSSEKYLRVDYERLSTNFMSTIKNAYKFLDLNTFEPEEKITKQVDKSVLDIIENYDELKSYFQNTEFSCLFGSQIRKDEAEPNVITSYFKEIEFKNDNLMRIGDYAFDLDASAAVANKYSREKTFVLMKERNLINEYLRTLQALRPNNILELGIRRGGSMAFYNLLFKPKVHIGVELDTHSIPALDMLSEQAAKEDRRLEPIFGFDQSDKARLLSTVRNRFPLNHRPLDVVIDDASHRLVPSISSFEALFPFVREGGIYAIEDWAWAHWPGCQGPRGYMADQPALTNLIFQLVILHTCRPDIIREIRVTPAVVFLERGPADLDPASFHIADHLIMRDRNLAYI